MFTTEDMVFTYSRAQALEDGVLVDVTQTAKEAGFKVPVAVSAKVWHDVVEPDQTALDRGESEGGRLWDVLWMARLAAKAAAPGDDLINFQALATIGER